MEIRSPSTSASLDGSASPLIGNPVLNSDVRSSFIEKTNITINPMRKVTPFLWFENRAEEAAKFYTSIFKNSKIIESSPISVRFELEGQELIAFNGGPHYKFNEAISLFVDCETQDEIDYYWSKLSKGGKPIQCGWLNDKFGLCWQIIPSILPDLIGGNDRVKADRAFKAMLKMEKLDIAKLKAAYNGK